MVICIYQELQYTSIYKDMDVNGPNVRDIKIHTTQNFSFVTIAYKVHNKKIRNTFTVYYNSNYHPLNTFPFLPTCKHVLTYSAVITAHFQ
jgi:hypothetical protein